LSDNQKHIEEGLYQYKVRLVKKRLLEGLIVFLSTIILVYLTISGLEAIGRFSSWGRALLLIGFLSTAILVLFIRIGRPLLQLLKAERAIGDEEAAERIGRFYPNLGDKLLNYIQLSAKDFSSNSLAKASLDQRANEMKIYRFSAAISFDRERQKVYRWIIPLVFMLTLLVLAFPGSFVGSTERIIHFSKPFIPEAPFQFDVTNELTTFRNEDFNLTVALSGDAVPEEAWFVSDNKRTKMAYAGVGLFELRFPNIEISKTFYIEAAGYNSKQYKIRVVDRPSLTRFAVNLNYPGHIKKRSESFQNIGNLEVPEGTNVTWQIDSRFTDQVSFAFSDDSISLEPDVNNKFTFTRQVLKALDYQIKLTNQFGSQEGSIIYNINIIKDEYPQLEVNILPDTVLYKYVVIAGNMRDDHGLNRLNLHYTQNGGSEKLINIPLDRGSLSQSIFYQWLLDSMNMAPGDNLEFYLRLTDNDAINNYKSVKSPVFRINIPSEEDQQTMLDENRSNAKEQISDAAEEAKELKENIDELAEQLKGKKELSWQEKQILENLVEQKQQLEEQIKGVTKRKRNTKPTTATTGKPFARNARKTGTTTKFAGRTTR
jgi:hypothetical protein